MNRPVGWALLPVIRSERLRRARVPILLTLFVLVFLSATIQANESVPASRLKRVLLRSSWQTVNIGDIAHTPGMLALLEKHLPDAEVTLWPNKLSDDVVAMLKNRFPKLRFAMSAETQKAALAECDFCLHGSGPGLVGVKTLQTWQATGKPYGFGGVTLNDNELKDHRVLLAGAKFVFCRDTKSLETLRATGISGPPLDFGPDATFLLDLRDDAKADAFLKEHSLEPKKFACFVPRLRWTPYWKEGRKYAPEELARKDAENQKFQEADHAKLRMAIIAWVRETGLKALLCPEMTYQVELLRSLLFDPLPDDVKPFVIVRPSYWLTDEAASTYARAAAVVSFEMHSPIIAIANGTPAIHLRQPTDTRKGQMWRDVGLSDWLFEIDETTGEQIAAKLLSLHRDPKLTEVTVAMAREFTTTRGRQMIEAITATDWNKQAELDAKLDRTTIAYDGKTPNKLVCDTTLRELPDGSWSLFMLAGDDFEPSPKNYIGLTRSTDSGKTWSTLEPVNIGFPREGKTSGQGPTELLVRDGRSTLFFSTHSQTWGRDWKSWSMHSDDLCRTWSKPEPMPGRLANFTFIRNHIITRDGRIVIPFQHYLGPGPDVPPPPAEEKPWHGALRHYVSNPRNGVLMSSDGGKTWTEHGNIRLTDDDRYHGWAENNIVELADGRIAMIIRGDRLGGVLYYAESRDGGRTWPASAMKTDIPNPGSKATLYPLGGDTVALLHNPNPSHRSPLALWISFDGLKTWPYRRVLVPESCDGPKGRLNYPDGFVSRDREYLHFAFDDNRHRAVYYGAKLPPLKPLSPKP